MNPASSIFVAGHRGLLESTNEWYAIAKIAGLKMCQAYRRQYGFNAISAMPTNLYGPGDNFSLHSSHVLPALLRKVHEAREAGGLADACLFLMQGTRLGAEDRTRRRNSLDL
jgi:nucleoside-diphosphate-sugar epimerase